MNTRYRMPILLAGLVALLLVFGAFLVPSAQAQSAGDGDNDLSASVDADAATEGQIRLEIPEVDSAATPEPAGAEEAVVDDGISDFDGEGEEEDDPPMTPTPDWRWIEPGVTPPPPPPEIYTWKGEGSTYVLGKLQSYCYGTGKPSYARLVDLHSGGMTTIAQGIDNGAAGCFQRVVTGPLGEHRLRIELLNAWGFPTGEMAETTYFVTSSSGMQPSGVVFYSGTHYTGMSASLQSGYRAGLPFVPRSVRFSGQYSQGWQADLYYETCNAWGCSPQYLGSIGGSRTAINWYGSINPANLRIEVRPW